MSSTGPFGGSSSGVGKGAAWFRGGPLTSGTSVGGSRADSPDSTVGTGAPLLQGQQPAPRVTGSGDLYSNASNAQGPKLDSQPQAARENVRESAREMEKALLKIDKLPPDEQKREVDRIVGKLADQIGTTRGEVASVALKAAELLRLPRGEHDDVRRMTWRMLTVIGVSGAACVSALMGIDGYSALESTQGFLQVMTTVGWGNVIPESWSSNAVMGTFGGLSILGWMVLGLLVQNQEQRREVAQTAGEFEGHKWSERKAPLVVLGMPRDENEALKYLEQIARDVKNDPELGNLPIAVVGKSLSRLPGPLKKQNIVWIKADPYSAEGMRTAGIKHAKAVLVLSEDASCDAEMIHAVRLAKEELAGKDTPVIAQVGRDRGEDSNMGRVEALGAIPIPSFMHMSPIAEHQTPGVTALYTDLISSGETHLFPTKVHDLADWRSWRDITTLCAHLGVPVAYRDAQGAIIVPQNADTQLNGVKELFFATTAAQPPARKAVAEALGVGISVEESNQTPSNRPVVLLGLPKDEDTAATFLAETLDEFAKVAGYENRPVRVVAESFPEGVRELAAAGRLELIQGDPTRRQSLENADVRGAEVVMVLAQDEKATQSNPATMLISQTVKELVGTSADAPRVFAELVAREDGSIHHDRRFLESMGVETGPAVRAEPALPAVLRGSGNVDVLERVFSPNQRYLSRVKVDTEATWRELTLALAPLGTPVRVGAEKGSQLPPPENVDERQKFGEILLINRNAAKSPTEKEIKQALTKLQGLRNS